MSWFRPSLWVCMPEGCSPDSLTCTHSRGRGLCSVGEGDGHWPPEATPIPHEHGIPPLHFPPVRGPPAITVGSDQVSP